MNRDAALHLIEALLARPNAIEDARRAFRERYPDAPKEMVDTAVFHVCVDGVDAALVWVAEFEQFLRHPKGGLNYGATWHLLYHLYNWQQFEALLPLGKAGMAEHLSDIKTLLDEGNGNAAKATIDRLLKCLEGDLEFPQF